MRLEIAKYGNLALKLAKLTENFKYVKCVFKYVNSIKSLMNFWLKSNLNFAKNIMSMWNNCSNLLSYGGPIMLT